MFTGGARVALLWGHLGLVDVSAILGVSWSVLLELSADWLVVCCCPVRGAGRVDVVRLEFGIEATETGQGGGLLYEVSGLSNFAPALNTFPTLCLL